MPSLAQKLILLWSIVLLASMGLDAKAEMLTPQHAASMQTTVLDSLEVDLGERSIFYNRIQPPVLKPWVRTKPAPAEQAQVYVPTAEELA